MLQRQCACGNHIVAGGECAECRKKRLQRKAANHDEPGTVPPIVHDVLRSPGQPLDPATRTFMEPRFGHDFSQVRVHTGERAAASAQAVNALAYTVGHNVVFGARQYMPTTHAGQRLLAHELAHTIQQQTTGSSAVVQTFSPIDEPDAPLEREASTAADQVMAGQKPQINRAVSQARPQRQADTTKNKMDRPTADGHIEVTRTITRRSCQTIPFTQSTPSSDIVYFDAQANAFGIRYQYCKGATTIEMDSQARYDRLRRDAEQLVKRLPQTILSGGDVFAQIQQTAQQTSVSASTTIAITISGTLRAEIKGTTEQGLQTRSYDVEGLFRLTPKGWALELGAAYKHVADNLQGDVQTISFTPKVNVGPVQAGVSVEQKEERPSGRAPSSTTTVRGTVSVSTGRGLGLTLSGSSENGGTFSITFGTVDTSQRIPDVPKKECVIRDCPPPQVSYNCVRVTKARPDVEEIQSPGHDVVQLHYELDKTTPADQTVHNQKLMQIEELVRNKYNVQDIEGYASPEASKDYNLDLSKRRAEQASADIRTQLSNANPSLTAVLPPAKGLGELLGGPIGTSDAALIAEIKAQLRDKPEDEQFKLFGLDPARMSEPERSDMRQRIKEFSEGKAGGQSLARRARWERLFPFLRRVDVTMDRPRLTKPIIIPEKREPGGNCDAETVAWAEQNMPPLPADLRLPDAPKLGF